MNRTDLERLAETLETRVPADRFNMVKWWDSESDCGCAIGWGNELDVLPAGLTLDDPWEVGVPKPVLGEADHFQAVARAYDIDLDTAYHLFNDENYYKHLYEEGFLEEDDEIEPQHVAARIREVLSGS